MEYNRLRLNKEELQLIKKRYPQIDYSNLMFLVEGMSTLRNVDILISSLEYDIEHKELPNEDLPLAQSIKEKAVYYRDHNGKNYVKGFNTDLFCKKADEICMRAINEVIGNDFYKIDQSINYLRSIKNRFPSDKELWKVCFCLGTKLGELMLDDKLLSLGFDWSMVKPKKYPSIIEPQNGLNVDPILFVFNKVKAQGSYEENLQTSSDLYYRFLEEVDKQLI